MLPSSSSPAAREVKSWSRYVGQSSLEISHISDGFCLYSSTGGKSVRDPPQEYDKIQLNSPLS